MASDPDIGMAGKEFLKGGWVVALLGILGALIRLLISKKKNHWTVWVKKGVAGGLVGVVMYFALYGAPIDQFYKSVLLSISGALSPDIFFMIEKKIKEKLNK